MSAQPTPTAREWNGYYYWFGEDERCVVTFHVPACDPRNQQQRISHGRRLIGFSPDQYISPQGMPTGPAFERLKAIETRVGELLAANRVPCWLVGKHVYRGMRELLFQVETPHLEAFERVCAQIEEEFGGTKLVPYEGWTFFNDKIRPDADAQSHISNRELLDALKEHGADFGKTHLLDHTFTGQAADLERLRDALSTYEGFRETGSSPGHLTVSSLSPLAQDEIDSTTRQLRALADELGVKYDGWGTMLDRSLPS